MSIKKAFMLLCLVTGISLGAGYAWKHVNKQEAPPSAPSPARVVSQIAEARDIQIYASGVGNIVPLNNIVIRAQIDGELISVNVLEGERVEKGALLARIDDRRIRADLARATAEKQSAEAQLNLARLDLDRFENLIKTDAVPRQRVDTQRAIVKQLEAAVAVASAAVDNANVLLSFAEIRSPITGMVGIRRVDAGNIVRAADVNGLFTITQLDPVTAVFVLPQKYIAVVLPLMQGDDRPVDIIPQGATSPVATGQLGTLDNQIDTNSGTIRLRALVKNDNLALWPGQFIVARVPIKTLRNAIQVPANAVQRNEKDAFVYIAKNGKAEKKTVTILHEDKDNAVIDGIAPAQSIIVDGLLRVRPGAPIAEAQ